MDIDEIMFALLQVDTDIYVKYVVDKGVNSCDECFKYDGEIFLYDDEKPTLPIHPNCKCRYVISNKETFLKQENFSFGKMKVTTWEELSLEDKNIWLNSFRKQFGSAINRYAKIYDVPQQLIAGIIANEMLDWAFPDGTWVDGLSGGGIGYAQISNKTAKLANIKSDLTTIDGSVEATAKLLKIYLEELKFKIDNQTLGDGFQKSDLYSDKNHAILYSKDRWNTKTPEWLLNSMCAVWNSGIEVLSANDLINDNNYPNAYNHGLNSSLLIDYLRKMVE